MSHKCAFVEQMELQVLQKHMDRSWDGMWALKKCFSSGENPKVLSFAKDQA